MTDTKHPATDPSATRRLAQPKPETASAHAAVAKTGRSRGRDLASDHGATAGSRSGTDPGAGRRIIRRAPG